MRNIVTPKVVIPAKAGVIARSEATKQSLSFKRRRLLRPNDGLAMTLAFAGMTTFVMLFTLSRPVFAKGPGTDAALNLLQLDVPRASSLGQAFTAVHDDIAAFNYNPASLATLPSSQFLFSHDQGAFDDSRSALLSGFKTNKGALGVAVGRYDSGEVTLNDGVSGPVSKTAQEDLMVDIGYGHRGQRFSVGGSLKYLSSTLAESAKASAYLLDVGANVPLRQNFRFGLSLPVLASDIKYASENEKLPRVIRSGFSYQTNFQSLERSLPPVLLLVDIPYSVNEHQVGLSAGVDVSFGLMALRFGYQTGDRLGGFSVGTGFRVNSLSLDYSFGIVSENNVGSVQKVSLSYHMGTASKPDPQISKVYEQTENQKRISEVLNDYRHGSTATVDVNSNVQSPEAPQEWPKWVPDAP